MMCDLARLLRMAVIAGRCSRTLGVRSCRVTLYSFSMREDRFAEYAGLDHELIVRLTNRNGLTTLVSDLKSGIIDRIVRRVRRAGTIHQQSVS